MQVLFDLQPVLGRPSGIYRYASELYSHLAPLDSSMEVKGFCFNFLSRHKLPGELKHVKENTWLAPKILRGFWRVGEWPSLESVFGEADVVHFSNFLSAPLKKAKAVLTIHDLGFLLFPESLATENLQRLTRELHKSIAHCDAIIAPSSAVAMAIEAELGVKKAKIQVVPLGIKSVLHFPTAEEISRFRQKFALSKPYLLCVGTIEPRKNHRFLLEVFEALDFFDGDLVIAGPLGWKYEEILRAIENSPCKARIKHLPNLSDDELALAYSGCELFIFPSLYEGFGLPPLEALSYGAPVISSGQGSLREVLGDAALVLNDFELENWRHHVRTVLESGETSLQSRKKGRDWVSQFTWQNAAVKTAAVYQACQSSS